MRLKGGPRDGRHTEGTLTAAEPVPPEPPSRAISGGRQSRAGQMAEVPEEECYMALSSRISVATGTSQRACHCAPPGSASACTSLAVGSGQGTLGWASQA